MNTKQAEERNLVVEIKGLFLYKGYRFRYRNSFYMNKSVVRPAIWRGFLYWFENVFIMKLCATTLRLSWDLMVSLILTWTRFWTNSTTVSDFSGNDSYVTNRNMCPLTMVNCFSIMCLPVASNWYSFSITIMMTSSNVNIFRVTGHLCGEFNGLRWIPRTKASDAEFWCFLLSVPE